MSSAALPRRPQDILGAFIPRIQGIFSRRPAVRSAPTTDGSLATPLPTTETKQLIIGRHYGTVVSPPKDEIVAPTASAEDMPVPADGMTTDEIRLAIEGGFRMVDLFSTETGEDDYDTFAAAQVKYSHRIRAGQYSGIPGSPAIILRLDARKTAFERGFITTLAVPATLVPSTSRKAVDTTTCSTTKATTATTISGADTTNGSGNTSVFRCRRPVNVSRKVKVCPIDTIAAPRTGSVPHKSTQPRPLFGTSKDHFQHPDMIDPIEHANVAPKIPDSDGPMANFATHFAKVVLATNVLVYSVGEQTRSILRALLKEALRVAIGFIVMCALWLVPNVGVELACIFLILWF